MPNLPIHSGSGVPPGRRSSPDQRLAASATAGPLTGRRPMPQRRGVAAVEFAVCLPLLVLLVFGSIEASALIFLKQSLHVAAYESARAAVEPGTDQRSATAAAIDILNSRGVVGFDLDFPGGDPAAVTRGTPIRVTATAMSGDNSPLLGQFLPPRLVTTSVEMIKQ